MEQNSWSFTWLHKDSWFFGATEYTSRSFQRNFQWGYFIVLHAYCTLSYDICGYWSNSLRTLTFPDTQRPPLWNEKVSSKTAWVFGIFHLPEFVEIKANLTTPKFPELSIQIEPEFRLRGGRNLGRFGWWVGVTNFTTVLLIFRVKPWFSFKMRWSVYTFSMFAFVCFLTLEQLA